MFGYSPLLLLARLFGIPLFVLGIIFLRYYWKDDRPRAMLRKSLKNPWLYLTLILTWIAFGLEIAVWSTKTVSGT